MQRDPVPRRNALDFSRRVNLAACPEWMDGDCTYEEFEACLRDLAQVNRLTLAYRPTLAWLEQFLGDQRQLHIVDVGSGGGDMLRHVERWAARRGMAVRLTGVDLNPFATRAARVFTSTGSHIHWITGDAFTAELPAPADLVISSLCTHHMEEPMIVRFLAWAEETAALGWFVNDLERARPPYFLFRALAWAMRWHRFVRHDGPVSIRRAFQVTDWQRMLAAAGLNPTQYRLEKWKPARLCVSRVRALA